MSRRRRMIAIGAAVLLAAWFAWKVVLTGSKIPTTPAPAARPEQPG